MLSIRCLSYRLRSCLHLLFPVASPLLGLQRSKFHYEHKLTLFSSTKTNHSPDFRNTFAAEILLHQYWLRLHCSLPNTHMHPFSAGQCPWRHGVATSLSQLRWCTGRSSPSRNLGCKKRTQTELSNMDICGDPSGGSALAIALHDVKKGFTTHSSPTIPTSIAVLLNFSHYYTRLPSLASWKARRNPGEFHLCWKLQWEVVSRRQDSLHASFPSVHVPPVLPRFSWLQTDDSSTSLGVWGGHRGTQLARRAAVHPRRAGQGCHSLHTWTPSHLQLELKAWSTRA